MINEYLDNFSFLHTIHSERGIANICVIPFYYNRDFKNATWDYIKRIKFCMFRYGCFNAKTCIPVTFHLLLQKNQTFVFRSIGIMKNIDF